MIEDIVIVGVLLLALLVIVVGIPVLIYRVVRDHRVQQRRVELHSRVFTGSPQVAIHPAGVKATITDILAVASMRGYVELPQPDPHVMLFGLDQAPPPVRQVPPSLKQEKARDSLTARLATGEPVWVRAGEVGMHPPELDVFARSHGHTIARVFGPRLDSVVLLSRDPVPSLIELVRPEDRAAMRSFQRRWTGTAAMLVGVAPMSASAMAAKFWDAPWAIAVGFLLFCVVVVLGLRWVTRNTRRDLTTRMRLVAAEFGRGPVTVLSNLLGVHPAVVTDVAAELGYQLVRSRHGFSPIPSQAEVWLHFAPIPGRYPR